MSTKGRRMRIIRGATPNSDINVTPLVDVVLVLLIIFMVVTPLLEKDIAVTVPETEKIDEPQDVPPDQLIVSLNEKGEIKINAESIAEADYVERLKRMVAAKKTGDRLVFFMPDDKANYGKLVTALDGAKVAGAETLGMMTEKVDAAPTPPGGTPAPPGAPTPPAPPSPPGSP